MSRERAIICERSQHSVGSGSGSGFGGPDTYVAVQIVPEGVKPLKYLNYSVAAKRGIRIVVTGQGYSSRGKTERSMLGAARAKAREIADAINSASNQAQAMADYTDLPAKVI